MNLNRDWNVDKHWQKYRVIKNKPWLWDLLRYTHMPIWIHQLPTAERRSYHSVRRVESFKLLERCWCIPVVTLDKFSIWIVFRISAKPDNLSTK